MADWEREYLSGNHGEEFDRIEAEVQGETGTAGILNASDAQILEKCFELPLRSGDMDESMAERLLARKPILEHVVLRAVERQDWDFLRRIVDVFLKFYKRLDPTIAELGHLGLALFSQDRDMDAEKLTGIMQ